MAKKNPKRPPAALHRSIDDAVSWELREPVANLTSLWDHTGDLRAVRVRALSGEEIRELIRSGPVRFVRCDWLGPLRWTEAQECYRFWKTEVEPHLCQDLRGHMTPAGYCYAASEWRCETGETVVLLEVDH